MREGGMSVKRWSPRCTRCAARNVRLLRPRAGRLDISSRTLRGSPDLLCKLRSLTRIKGDNRVNVSRVKKAVDDWINQTAQTVEVNVPELPKLGNALAGRPKWVAGRPHRETRSGAW
jgi:hypothetical protein